MTASGWLDQASGRLMLSLLSASVKETRNILEHWVTFGSVATSFELLVEPSQIVSLEQCSSVVRTAATLKLLDIAGLSDAFKGQSGRLHWNWLFWLGNCVESSWTSSRNLWQGTWLQIRHCPYYLKILNKTNNPIKKQLSHKIFLSTKMLPIENNNKLPPLVILGQKTFDWFGNTFSVQKQKILLIFVSKGQRVKRV